VPCKLHERRVAVDLRRFDRGLVLLVHLAQQRDAADGIEAEVDELRVLVDVTLVHLQLAGEQRPDAGGEGTERIASPGSGGALDRPGRHRGCRRHFGDVGIEVDTDLLGGVGAADECAVVHRQLALVGLFQRLVHVRGQLPFQGDQPLP
jgi:hypothetical protein